MKKCLTCGAYLGVSGRDNKWMICRVIARLQADRLRREGREDQVYGIETCWYPLGTIPVIDEVEV